MKLYLVQHAAAKSKQEDPERPLSEQGRADIGKVAAYVAEHASIELYHIIHSGKTRAQQTAAVLAEALPFAGGIEVSADLAPLVDVSIWAKRLVDMHKDVMLVGHLPHLGKLAALLICQAENKKVINFQMGGVVCLSRDETGDWSVQWMVTPEIAR